MSFDVFPPWLVTPVLQRTPLDVGDTVALRYHFLPGIDLFFASRVIDRFDGPDGGLWRTGFRYRTLAGHPEFGEETFCVEKEMATGRVMAAMRSWSRTGTTLAWLGYPLVRRMQIRANRLAMAHLALVAQGPLLTS